MKNKFNFTNQLSSLTEEEQSACHDAFVVEKYHKGDFLVKENQYCNKVYFLRKGSVRAFSHKQDREITNWFSFENEAFTSYYSFMTKKPSRESIQFLEGGEVHYVTSDQLQSLYDQYRGIERLGREIIEYYYNWQEERIFSLQCETSIERYQKLLHQESHLLEKASLGHIASYLGITQETLSRIRKEIGKLII